MNPEFTLASEVYDNIVQALRELDRPIVLTLIDPMRYQEAVFGVLKYFADQSSQGVYVTLNKPFSVLTKNFDRAGIPSNSLFFVDGVTNVPSVEEGADHACLGSGIDLSNLCIGISRAVSKLKDEKFLLLDSLSTLLIYNDSKAVSKFAHLLTEKMRRWNTEGSLLTVEMNAEKDIVSQLAPFCDKVVKI
jgi:KaiC/GvpD/RAD55 family RecA-like ATPase